MTQIVLRDSEYIVSDVSVSTVTHNFVTESLSGKVNAKSRGLHQLEVQFKVTLPNQHDIKRFNALMLKIRGRLNPFVLSLTDSTDAKHFCNPFVFDQTVQLNQPAQVGATTIHITSPDVVPAGTMFQLPNDKKVYTTLDDVNMTGSTEVFPAIRIQHTVNTTLKTVVEPVLRLTEDDFELSYENAKEITLKAREVL